ncbi:tetratricopeptide repeat protein [Sodalinema gerasimenkoae]|uniref:tetratricopeptide repeat protein n=1 Tax=Sodalinema gerasimenkoae TaxID=2862348 RepID=UPI00135CD154|nr:hypothetical protein [Sodalinema gerasimenkoae]
MKLNLKLLLLTPQVLLILFLTVLPGCGLVRGILDYGNPDSRINKRINKSLSLSEIWEDLTVPTPSGDALRKLRNVQVTLEDLSDLKDLYDKTNDQSLKLEIIRKLGTQTVSRSWLKEIIERDDKSLASLSFRILLWKELTLDQNRDDQWTNWQWTPYVRGLLERAVEDDLYLLSHLFTLELLQLANRYPESKFTKGAQEYASLAGGGAYFGSSGKKSFFRQPFNPSTELEIWPDFIDKYEDHPGVNDAMYRVARAYELQGKYEKALLWYQKAYRHVDNDHFSLAARRRILFIIDMIVDIDFLEDFIKSHPENSLVPALIYSKAIHLFREDRLLEAKYELEKFLSVYRGRRISGILGDLYNGDVYLDQTFFQIVENQVNHIKEIKEIRESNSDNATKLYEEARVFFYNERLLLNHLWESRFFSNFRAFVPREWEGASTSVLYTINFDFFQKAMNGFNTTNELLKALELFQGIISDYPESDLKEKAAYSVGLTYYWLHHEGWWTRLGQEESWLELGVQAFDDFVDNFPQSFLADDALISIATLTDDEGLKIQALRRIIDEYPRGDRRREAEKILSEKGLSIN